MISSKQKRIDELEASLEQARLAIHDLEAKCLEAQDLANSSAIEAKALRNQLANTMNTGDIDALRAQLSTAKSTAEQQRRDIDGLQQALSKATHARHNSEAGFKRLKRKITRLEKLVESSVCNSKSTNHTKQSRGVT